MTRPVQQGAAMPVALMQMCTTQLGAALPVHITGSDVPLGGTVISDHAELDNLEYSESGHTGFAGTEVENTFTRTLRIVKSQKEILLNNSFTSDLSEWEDLSGSGMWTWDNGSAKYTDPADNWNALQQTIHLVKGVTYELSFEVTGTTGYVEAYIWLLSGVGIWKNFDNVSDVQMTSVFTATETSERLLRIDGGTQDTENFDWTVQSVSLKALNLPFFELVDENDNIVAIAVHDIASGKLRIAGNVILNDVSAENIIATSIATNELSMTGYLTVGGLTAGVGGAHIKLLTTTPPVNANSQGEVGMFRWDANYIYICVALNTWKRVALSSW